MLSLILLALLFVAAAASCLAVSSAAEARPHVRHHHRVYHHAAHHRHHRKPKADQKATPDKRSFVERLFGVTIDASRATAARKFEGMTARQLGLPRSLWCADFVNMIERRLGRSGTGSRAAASFASYGRRLSGPQVGAIAVMHRRGGGHVGIVTGTVPEGVVIISGNHLGAVREAVYPRNRPYAYRG